MLQMNLITQEELCVKLYWELYGEVYQPLGSQILTDFSHSKISRV